MKLQQQPTLADSICDTRTRKIKKENKESKLIYTDFATALLFITLIITLMF